MDIANAMEEKSQLHDAKAVDDGLRIWHADYRRLLSEVLNIVNVTLPNKQQHGAATHMVRQAFDKTYFVMLHTTHPDSQFGMSEGSYAVEPL